MLAKDFTTSNLDFSPVCAAIETPPVITWEKLPADFILPDDPVEDRHQNPIANALSESLSLAGLLGPNAFTCTDYGLIATVNGKTIAKAPDWAYIANITVSHEEIVRSYTPYLEGDTPTIVIEVMSHTEGEEYSKRPANPMGKWYFYEQVLKVPYYGIFEPTSGDFELYHLSRNGKYIQMIVEESGRYWIEPMGLTIAAWKGKRYERAGYWLRFWDESGCLLPWANEIIEDQQRSIATSQEILDQARQRAEMEKARADRLADRLRALGIEE